LPDITRVIIANKKFDLLDELFLLLAQHKTEDSFAKVPLAAGFVMASAYNLELEEMERSKKYAFKSIEYSSNKFQILSRAMELLVKTGAAKEAEDAYKKSTNELITVEDKIRDLMLKEIIFPKAKVLLGCRKLLSEKVTHPELYQITINCLKGIGKDPEEVYLQAKRIYPQKTFTK
jgi:hypothetical protein